MDSTLRSLSSLVAGKPLPQEDDGPARRTQIILAAAAASCALAGIFGFAVASGDLGHALGNLIRTPVVVVLGSLVSLPAAMLAWKLKGVEGRASDMALGLAAGTLSGALVLAVLSPLVGLYYHTSVWMGPVLALVTAALALGTGLIIVWRTVQRRAPSNKAVRLPLMVFTLVHFATVTQLVAISNIMPEATFLDQGLEGLAER